MVEDRERRKRKKELYIIFATALAIVGVTFVEVHLKEGKWQGSNLFFFTMLNINIILLLLLLFLVIRNIGKVLLERKKGFLGSRLRTKLVLAFLVLSLVPAGLLFVTSAVFISRSVQGWFSTQVEGSLRGALEVAQLYYRDLSLRCVKWSKEAYRGLDLERVREMGGVSWVGLYDPEGRQVKAISAEGTPPILTPPEELVRRALEGKEGTQVTPFDGGEMVWGGFGGPKGAVVTGYWIPEGILSKMETISKAYLDYRRSELMKKPITLNYLLLLSTVTLLLAFWAIWLGFKVARDITQPVGSLLEGTRRVAEGDLDFQLEVTSGDEIGALVEAFNRMTSDLRRTQEALEERRRYIEVVLENVSAGIISFDKKGRITTLNRRAEELLEMKAEEALGRYYREVLKPDFLRVARDLIGEMNRRGTRRVEKQTEVSLDGKVMTLKVSLNALRDEEGEYLGMVAVFDDMTQLVKMQRLAAWRDVARRIAHEIKNPLTPIQLSAERIWRRYKDKINDQVFEECTRTIIQQVKELKRMVNEFSQFARMPAVVPRLDDLNSIIREVVVLYQQAHPQVTFSFLPDPSLPQMKVDREALKRALMNLLENAVNAVDGRGRVEVETSYNPSLQMATIEVRDDGCGVADELKPRIFEPYFSTKGEGRGLGLAIVNAIVADHDGFIRVRDNAPRGSRFIIELPVRR